MLRQCALVFLVSATCIPATNAALITHYDLASGNNVIEDTTTGVYWYSVIGLGQAYWEIESAIDSLNSSAAYGITNWQLAGSDAVNDLLYNNIAAISLYFEQTHVTTGQEIIPDWNPLCGLPYSPPCNDQVYNYTETHWQGIVDEPIILTTSLPDPFDYSLDCLLYRNCNTLTIEEHAHWAIDYVIRDYDDASNFPYGDNIVYVDERVVLDNYDPLSSSDSIVGAWVMGTNPVPLPASIWLMSSVLPGLLLLGRRR